MRLDIVKMKTTFLASWILKAKFENLWNCIMWNKTFLTKANLSQLVSFSWVITNFFTRIWRFFDFFFANFLLFFKTRSMQMQNKKCKTKHFYFWVRFLVCFCFFFEEIMIIRISSLFFSCCCFLISLTRIFFVVFCLVILFRLRYK